MAREVGIEGENLERSIMRALIRNSEDQLAILDAKIASGEMTQMRSLVTQITGRLNEIEGSEPASQKLDYKKDQEQLNDAK